MRKLILFILTFFTLSFLYSQEDWCYDLRTTALDVGVYDYSKAEKTKLEALHGEEALKAVEKRVKESEGGIDYFMDTLKGWMTEQEILSYYPTVDVALLECPVTTVAVFDIRNRKFGFGDPSTYVYSPSGRYRFSTLVADGPHFYLEEKINNEYKFCVSVIIRGTLDSFYWHNDDTIYYLKERHKDSENDEPTKYWVAYATQIKSVKCR